MGSPRAADEAGSFNAVASSLAETLEEEEGTEIGVDSGEEEEEEGTGEGLEEIGEGSEVGLEEIVEGEDLGIEEGASCGSCAYWVEEWELTRFVGAGEGSEETVAEDPLTGDEEAMAGLLAEGWEVPPAEGWVEEGTAVEEEGSGGTTADEVGSLLAVEEEGREGSRVRTDPIMGTERGREEEEWARRRGSLRDRREVGTGTTRGLGIRRAQSSS